MTRPQHANQLVLWPTSHVPRKILFHSDFDGICSAAVLLRFFDRDIKLEPVEYTSHKTTWLKRRVEVAAIVDFLYHPDALWWFDHHETSFMDQSLKEEYKPDERHRWDTSYPSCPPLILDVLSESDDVSSLRKEFSEWITWANIIDSAKYENPHQATDGDEPCIRINQALGATTDPDLRRLLVREIASGTSPEKLARHKEVEPLWQALREKIGSALELTRDRLQILDNVALCDITDKRVLFLRYGVYCFAPEIEYSFLAYDKQSGIKPYKISLSYNPWLDPKGNEENLGEIASEYGGGGRKTVGSISFESSHDCSRVAKELASRVAGSLTDKHRTGH